MKPKERRRGREDEGKLCHIQWTVLCQLICVKACLPSFIVNLSPHFFHNHLVITSPWHSFLEFRSECSQECCPYSCYSTTTVTITVLLMLCYCYNFQHFPFYPRCYYQSCIFVICATATVPENITGPWTVLVLLNESFVGSALWRAPWLFTKG